MFLFMENALDFGLFPYDKNFVIFFQLFHLYLFHISNIWPEISLRQMLMCCISSGYRVLQKGLKKNEI